MHKTLAPRQLFALLFLVLISNALTIGKGLDRNGWLSLILALVFVLPFYALLLKVHSTGNEQNLFDRITHMQGVFFGGCFLLILGTIALLYGVVSLRNFIVLTRAMALARTNSFLLGGILMFSVILFAADGILQAGRWAAPVFWMTFVFLVASILMTIPSWDPENLFPLLKNGWSSPLRNSVTTALSMGTDSIFLICMIDNRQKIYTKPALHATVYAFLLLVCVFLRNLFLLGYSLSARLADPSYTAASLISLGSFFQRGEVLMTIPFVLCDLLKMSLFLMFAKNCVLACFPKLSHIQTSICLGIPVFAAGSVLSEVSWDPTYFRYKLSVLLTILLVLFSLVYLLWHRINLHRTSYSNQKPREELP